MKIAVVTAATDSILKFRIDMIDEFVKRGHEVLVLGNESVDKWGDFFASHQVSYRQYFISRNGTNPFLDLKTRAELKDLFLEEKPDKIFTYQVKPNIYGALAAKDARIKEVYAMMGGLGSIFHSSDTKSRLMKGIVSAEYRAAFRAVKKAFFQNKDDVETFKKNKIVQDEQVVMVHGSGVNLEKFPQRPIPNVPVFLFVGRLVRGKGIFEYLDAARIVKKDFPSAEFHIVGFYDSNPTSLKPEELEPYIDEGTVIYHGGVEPDEIQAFVESCSVFVLPSYYGEGTPKSALEAMATGRPLIVADAVGSREVVHNGVNGFLVPPRNSNAVADAMRVFISNKEALIAMGQKSRALAEELFDVRKVNSTICEEMGI